MTITQTPTGHVAHPHLPGWTLATIPLARLVPSRVTTPEDEPLYITRDEGPAVARCVHELIERVDTQTLVGLDLRRIGLMPSFLWRQFGPLLHARVADGAFGPAKRVMYLTGGDPETLASLQSTFAAEAVEGSSRGIGKLLDRAGIVPADRKGYAGILRKSYEEVFHLVNRLGSATTEDVVRETGQRYSPNNASNYFVELAALGLVVRDLAPKAAGGFASRAYSLSVPEEAFKDALTLL